MNANKQRLKHIAVNVEAPELRYLATIAMKPLPIKEEEAFAQCVVNTSRLVPTIKRTVLWGKCYRECVSVDANDLSARTAGNRMKNKARVAARINYLLDPLSAAAVAQIPEGKTGSVDKAEGLAILSELARDTATRPTERKSILDAIAKLQRWDDTEERQYTPTPVEIAEWLSCHAGDHKLFAVGLWKLMAWCGVGLQECRETVEAIAAHVAEGTLGAGDTWDDDFWMQKTKEAVNDKEADDGQATGGVETDAQEAEAAVDGLDDAGEPGGGGADAAGRDDEKVDAVGQAGASNHDKYVAKTESDGINWLAALEGERQDDEEGGDDRG